MLNEFCNSELSAFYLDVLKDRLYTLAPKDTRRLSAQTALWKITEGLVRLVAPILSFTADEVWEYLPRMDGRESSVHIANFPEQADFEAPFSSPEAVNKWATEQVGGIGVARQARDIAMKALETARSEKKIGKGLDAKLIFTVGSPEIAAMMHAQLQALPEVFGVSQVVIQSSASGAGVPEVEVAWQPADGQRCERCWRYTMDVGSEGMYPTVCARCSGALEKIGFPPYPAQEAA